MLIVWTPAMMEGAALRFMLMAFAGW